MKNFVFIVFLCLNFVNICKASPSYTAEISVDETNESVSLAKEQAINKATRSALNDIVLSISTTQAVEEISKLNDNQIQHFVKEMQILMEKSSDIRYIADLKIEIKEDILKEYLKENNFPIIINEIQNVLLIPLFEKKDNTLNLWTEENLLREELLNKTSLKTNLINFQVIEKNLGNITATNPKTIYEMDKEKFNELASFNSVDNIAVIKYSEQEKKVYIKIFPSQQVFEEDITLRDNMSTMIEKTFNIIKANTKKITQEVTKSTANSIDVVYTYPDLSSWMKLKKQLESNPQVDTINIISMANKKVHFNFTYTGIIEKLQTELSLNGFNLKNNGEFYVIN